MAEPCPPLSLQAERRARQAERAVGELELELRGMAAAVEELRCEVATQTARLAAAQEQCEAERRASALLLGTNMRLHEAVAALMEQAGCTAGAGAPAEVGASGSKAATGEAARAARVPAPQQRQGGRLHLGVQRLARPVASQRLTSSAELPAKATAAPQRHTSGHLIPAV